MTKNHVAHDTVPFFMERFRDAYPAQLQNFVDNLRHDREPPITIDDAMGSLRIASRLREPKRLARCLAEGDDL